MAVVTPTDVQNLQAARSAAISNLLQLEQAGPMRFGLNYSIDGRSYSWVEAKKYYADAINNYTDLIAKLSLPWVNVARAR